MPVFADLYIPTWVIYVRQWLYWHLDHGSESNWFDHQYVNDDLDQEVLIFLSQ